MDNDVITMKIDPQKEQKDYSKWLEKDFDHFAASLAKNEDIGEKRLDFFVKLVTFVVTGISTLYSALYKDLDNPTINQLCREVTVWGLLSLIVFGILTYLRMLKRLVVANQYKRVLRRIRETWYEPSTEQTPIYYKELKSEISISKYFSGNYPHIAGTMTAMLSSALIYYLLPSDWWPKRVALLVGIILTIIAWYIANHVNNKESS